jgi:hypothetical protein
MEFERWIYNESWPVYDTLALEMFFLKKKKFATFTPPICVFFFFNMDWRLWWELNPWTLLFYKKKMLEIYFN